MTNPGVPSGSGPTWWPSELTERQRVLVHAQPLFDQRRNEGSQPDEARHYDSLALSLRVLELVLEASGLEDAVTAAHVHEALRPALLAMDVAAGIAPDADRHGRAVERMLGGLRNDAEGRRPFQVKYTAFEPDGRATTRLLEFRLLFDAHHPDGTIVLRATVEGANLYLRALALDLESQQAAAEAIVDLQLRRGRFQDAFEAARQAQRQSIRYGEILRDRLEQTRRDLSRVDWREEMPALLADAHVHLETRLEVEDRLLGAVDARLEALEPGSEAAQQVARVRKLLADCRARHQDLHRVVLGSRQTFLREQARQTFVPRLLITRPDLGRQVLEPILGAKVADVVALSERSMALLAPPTPTGVLWLAELLEWQLQPRHPGDPNVTPEDARDLVEVPDEPRYFPPDVQEAGEVLLRGVSAPTPLSVLLAVPGAADAPRPVRDYVVLRALQAAATEPPGADDPHYLPMLRLRAVAHGVLDTPEFAGDDLLLMPSPAPPAAATLSGPYDAHTDD